MKNVLLKKKSGFTAQRRMDLGFIWIMLAIPILHWLIFWLYVNFDSILLAFKIPSGEWSTVSLESVFLSLKEGGSELNTAIKNTFLYFIKDTLMIPFQLLLAYFLHKKIKFYGFFRVMFYLPVLISGVAMVQLYSSMIAPSGPIGDLLKSFGVNPVPQFLGDSRYATNAILIYTIWVGLGGHLLILCGALARIPIDILESAKIDGANNVRELTDFIIPLMWPTLSTLFILNLTGIFSAGGPILLFDSSKMDVKITTIAYWIFDKVYTGGAAAYNEVAATGLIFTLVGVPVIMTLKWLIEKVPQVDY